MSYSKLLLTIAWIMSFEATCGACCDDDPGCAGWTSKTACDDVGDCIWTGSICREYGCSDYNQQFACESKYGYDGCVWVGGVCKVPTCADYTSTQCEGSNLGINGRCKYDSATESCTLTTSCSDWTDRELDCGNKGFSDTDGYHPCEFLENQCKVSTCANYASSQDDCESYHSKISMLSPSCKYDSGTGSCTRAVSCGDWTDRGPSDCPSFCVFADNECREKKCEDLPNSECLPYGGCTFLSDSNSCSTASSCSAWDRQNHGNCTNSYIGDKYGVCAWNATDNTCVPKPACSSLPRKTDCEDNDCVFTDTCSAIDAGSSHAVFVHASSLLVMLLLAFLV